MGCGVSRFEAPIHRVRTTRINPRLHRRLEEIKRKGRSTRSLKKAAPSKKLLLRHHSNEDVGEFITHFNPLFEEMQKNTKPIEDIKSCVTSEGSRKPSEDAPFKGTFESNVRDEKEEKVKGQNANAEVGEKEDGTEDEKRIGCKEGVFPGSPSFRIYYVENADDDKNESNNENQTLEESTYHIQNEAQGEVSVPLKNSTCIGSNIEIPEILQVTKLIQLAGLRANDRKERSEKKGIRKGHKGKENKVQLSISHSREDREGRTYDGGTPQLDLMKDTSYRKKA